MKVVLGRLVYRLGYVAGFAWGFVAPRSARRWQSRGRS